MLLPLLLLPCAAVAPGLLQSSCAGRVAAGVSWFPPLLQSSFADSGNPFLFRGPEDTAGSWQLSPLHYKEPVTSMIRHFLWDLIKDSVSQELAQIRSLTYYLWGKSPCFLEFFLCWNAFRIITETLSQIPFTRRLTIT